MKEHEDSKRLYDRLGQTRANNGGNLTKEEWLNISAEQFKAARADAIAERKALPKAKREKGARNVLFDALATACGLNLQEITKLSGRAIGVALADIRSVSPDLSVEEIQIRVKKYIGKHPTWALTPPAIAKNWATLGDGRSRDKTKAAQFDVYQEPVEWLTACHRIWGLDVGGQIHARGWKVNDTNIRAQILKDIVIHAPPAPDTE